ncbi:hypothetical protein HYPSUDRAFT_207117 [Hypholoma sublateritium FD-334 SS-4]|uniref:Uncharacterized protein n=1 Tax=Hypholoma sublateritium (strain FD-334 SS-4) TaxID=945553 RepID=A0A0D2NAX4_HYPSF|nr:hypothetical protein HYPSUDRAFT_207117 [Hypholoma sublateritium FD-334 SS-4]
MDGGDESRSPRTQSPIVLRVVDGLVPLVRRGYRISMCLYLVYHPSAGTRCLSLSCADGHWMYSWTKIYSTFALGIYSSPVLVARLLVAALRLPNPARFRRWFFFGDLMGGSTSTGLASTKFLPMRTLQEAPPVFPPHLRPGLDILFALLYGLGIVVLSFASIFGYLSHLQRASFCYHFILSQIYLRITRPDTRTEAAGQAASSGAHGATACMERCWAGESASARRIRNRTTTSPALMRAAPPTRALRHHMCVLSIRFKPCVSGRSTRDSHHRCIPHCLSKERFLATAELRECQTRPATLDVRTRTARASMDVRRDGRELLRQALGAPDLSIRHAILECLLNCTCSGERCVSLRGAVDYGLQTWIRQTTPFDVRCARLVSSSGRAIGGARFS